MFEQKDDDLEGCFFSKFFLPYFIMAYRSSPCLWQKKPDKCFTNEEIEESYRVLVELAQIISSESDLQYVKEKIEQLRNLFLKEHEKVVASKQKGYVYEPNIWYYENLKFLIDEEDDADSSSDETTFKYEEMEFETPLVIGDKSYNKARRLCLPKTRNRSMLPTSVVDGTVDLAKLYRPDKCKMFGDYVTSKIRRMEKHQRSYAKKIIEEAVVLGSLGKLRENASIAVMLTTDLK